MHPACFTIHTMRPADAGHGEQLSSRFVAADNIQAALAALDRPAHPEAALREGERPIGWSPEASKSFGGSKRHTQLWEEAKAAGRLVYEVGSGYEPAIKGSMVRDLLATLKPGSQVPDDLRLDANDTVHRLALELQSGGLDPYGATDRALQLLGYTPDTSNVVDAEVPKEAMAMGDLPGDIRRALRDMEAAYGPAIATGIFLDNIGAQFNVRRVPGESDEAYRARMGEEISKPAASTDERKRELATTCREFVADKQAEHADHTAMLARDAAGAEYSSWVIKAKPRAAAAKPAWHSVSPDLARSTHQVDPDHGSALLRPLREGKA